MKLKTEIPVIIYTGYEYEKGDEAANRRQQIEKLGFYLQSIFSLLKSSAREHQSGSLDYQMQVFLDDVEHLSEIGFGIAGAIFPAASEFENLEKNEQTLATQIANLLAHPDIPDELHDKMMDGLDNLGAITKHKSLTKVEKSADFISRVLTDYKEVKDE